MPEGNPSSHVPPIGAGPCLSPKPPKVKEGRSGRPTRCHAQRPSLVRGARAMTSGPALRVHCVQGGTSGALRVQLRPGWDVWGPPRALHPGRDFRPGPPHTLCPGRTSGPGPPCTLRPGRDFRCRPFTYTAPRAGLPGLALHVHLHPRRDVQGHCPPRPRPGFGSVTAPAEVGIARQTGSKGVKDGTSPLVLPSPEGQGQRCGDLRWRL